MTYAPSSARTTGPIASYISRVSSQSLTRRASSIRTTPFPNLLTFGDSAGLSNMAKQSSIYSVCARLRRVILDLRSETVMAIASANSCAVSGLIPKFPYRGKSSAPDTAELNQEGANGVLRVTPNGKFSDREIAFFQGEASHFGFLVSVKKKLRSGSAQGRGTNFASIYTCGYFVNARAGCDLSGYRARLSGQCAGAAA